MKYCELILDVCTINVRFLATAFKPDRLISSSSVPKFMTTTYVSAPGSDLNIKQTNNVMYSKILICQLYEQNDVLENAKEIRKCKQMLSV